MSEYANSLERQLAANEKAEKERVDAERTKRCKAFVAAGHTATVEIMSDDTPKSRGGSKSRMRRGVCPPHHWV